MKFFTILTFIFTSYLFSSEYKPLKKAPKTIEIYNEIATIYDSNLSPLYNKLAKEERVLLYYLFRASLPGNRIIKDQLHRDSIEITEMFENILKNQNKLKFNRKFSEKKFIEDVKIYLTYLWSNHSQYFAREFINHKRTPRSLKLKVLTKRNLIWALEIIGDKKAKEKVSKISKSIFDKNFEPTLTVAGNIDESAVNIYSKNFTDKNFQNISTKDQKYLNAYYHFDKNGKENFSLYKIDEKYDQELKVSYFWLNKAYLYAKKHSKYFDKHLISSIEYLLDYIKTGDEDFFKKHSKEWLLTNNKIDYLWGFIEAYKDPKSYRGFFEAEGTIKYIDVSNFKKILPGIEKKLPFKQEYKKEIQNTKIPNVSINTQVFATGDLGPLQSVAAYCLPNYEEIRSEYGSKQIIFHQSESIAEKINPELAKKLFYLKEDLKWFNKNDKNFKLPKDITTLLVLLHETIGHGSGKFANHTFVKNDQLEIDKKIYKVGDEIKVTSSNIQEFLSPHSQTLEELRAEILALYVSVEFYDSFRNIKPLKEWKNIDREKMQQLLIINMAKSGLLRLFQQPIDANEVRGDHARADYTILNYLIDGGGIKIISETVEVDRKDYTVLGIKIIDFEKTKRLIKELAILVQTIKSTGDGVKCRELLSKYGIHIRNKNYIKILHDNKNKILKNLKATTKIFPIFTPVYNEENKEIFDINATWPKDIFENYKNYSSLQLSID